MGVSSNILWHQTGKEGFYGILKSKRLRYCNCSVNPVIVV